jgi:N utilization substance protein B
MKARSRHKAREKALQILYKVDIAECGPEDNFTSLKEDGSLDAGALEYCETLVNGVLGKRKEIDRTIESSSEHWRLERMSVVDRNILRVAVYELRYITETPFKVIIDEAVELAKRFGSVQSGAFINGVLDRVHKDAIVKDLAGVR